MNVIEFNNATKIYLKGFFRKKITAVKNLSFTLSEPGITGFIGPNGAGKTTSIKMLLGLVRPTSGSVSIRGISSEYPKARNKVAFVSEQPYFYPYLTIYESLAFVYKLNGYNLNKLKNEMERVLNAVHLENIGGRKINEFSKGMQQRLNMAHAIIGNPDLFIFDEPMSGLDPIGRRLFKDIFCDLADQGKSVFFSTHILEDIESFCDKVVVLSNGSLVYSGNIRPLLSRGVLGTEIVVKNLTDENTDVLSGMKFEISTFDNEEYMIFIPSGGDVDKCQEYLYSNHIYPVSIKPRVKSLESILYENTWKVSAL